MRCSCKINDGGNSGIRIVVADLAVAAVEVVIVGSVIVIVVKVVALMWMWW